MAALEQIIVSVNAWNAFRNTTVICNSGASFKNKLSASSVALINLPQINKLLLLCSSVYSVCKVYTWFNILT